MCFTVVYQCTLLVIIALCSVSIYFCWKHFFFFTLILLNLDFVDIFFNILQQAHCFGLGGLSWYMPRMVNALSQVSRDVNNFSPSPRRCIKWAESLGRDCFVAVTNHTWQVASKKREVSGYMSYKKYSTCANIFI